MKYRHCWSLALLFCAVQPVTSATQERDRPEQEMFKMIDLLRDMEVIKQMKIIQDMQDFEASGDPLHKNAPRKAASLTATEPLK